MKSRRVIVIDPKEKSITEASVKNLADMQAIVGGRIERALTLPTGDEIYVNEEGLFTDALYAFRVPGLETGTYFGKAYVIGGVTNSGDNFPCELTTDFVSRNIQFLGKVVVE